MALKYSTEGVNKELNRLGIKLKEPYKGMLKPHDLEYVKCGHTCNQVLNNVLNIGTRCSECSRPRGVRLTQKQAAYRLKQKGFILLEPYKGSSISVKMTCTKCGFNIMQYPNLILSLERECPICNSIKRYSIE